MCKIKDEMIENPLWKIDHKEKENPFKEDWKCYCGKPPRTPNSILCKECDYQSRNFN